MQLEKIINTAYSFGAAIVVFGAWAKLGNKEYAETALTTGLLTETGIFFIYGLLEWRKQPSGKESQATDVGDTEELTETLKKTNRILDKVFKTE
jgi:hypothetical protein